MLLYMISIIYFFSSRRRHTISKRDWSSDVCSSDLPGNERLPYSYPFTKSCYAQSKFEAQQLALHYSFQSSTSVIVVNPTFMLGRSEERSVGKERIAVW